MFRFGLAMLVYLMLAVAIQTRIMLAARGVPLDYPIGGLSFWALASLGLAVWRWTYPRN
jgi:hypothetical protein